MTAHLGDLLSGLVDGELSAEEEAAARLHLAACAACRHEMEEVGTARSWVRALPPVDAPLGFYERLLSKGKPATSGLAPGRGWAALVGIAAAGLVMLGLVSPRDEPVTPDVDRLVQAHATAEASGDDVSQLVPAAIPVVLAAASAPVAQATGTPPGEHPLQRARRAVDEVPFRAVVEVSWSDGDDVRRRTLDVEAQEGTFVVRGEDGVVVEGPDEERLVRADGDDWARAWPASDGSPLVPDPGRKYETTTLEGNAEVAGRMVSVVEIRQGGRLRDRLYLDGQTGLPLRREQFDDAGQPERGFQVQTLAVGDPAGAPPAPAYESDRTPRPVFAAPSSSAPKVLPDGYVQVGSYRRGDVLHLLYTDGLYNLSLFEQPGRLELEGLPDDGRQVRIGRNTGTLYGWAGGSVLVWRDGHLVLTIVSDAPSDHLIAAAGSVSASTAGSPSLLEKIRLVGEDLVDPLS